MALLICFSTSVFAHLNPNRIIIKLDTVFEKPSFQSHLFLLASVDLTFLGEGVLEEVVI